MLDARPRQGPSLWPQAGADRPLGAGSSRAWRGARSSGWRPPGPRRRRRHARRRYIADRRRCGHARRSTMRASWIGGTKGESMTSLRVRQIRSKLRDLFESHLDLRDLGSADKDRETKVLTRCLAAFAIYILTGCSEEAAKAVWDGQANGSTRFMRAARREASCSTWIRASVRPTANRR